MKRIFAISILAMGVFTWASLTLAAQGLNFAVIQPGQPGTPEEAQPVMDLLAAYIQRKLGLEGPLKGLYFNDKSRALDFLKRNRPSWGIVGLGFYVEHASHFHMTPISSTRPRGFQKDIWRLAVSRDAPDDWEALGGKVRGTMLFDRDAAACLLFGNGVDRLPFKLAGTFHPLRSLRSAARGKSAGVALDRLQYDAMKALPLACKLKIIHVTTELPTSPVVWFGPTDPWTARLISTLADMHDDPDAQGLLPLLQTEGFGPPDMNLPELRLGANEKCPR